MSGRARAILGPGGPLAGGLDAYEEREGQLAMADAVERALDDEAMLVVEAGTGTGKTLAYLVPALLSGKKVVVSTATKALEEQIFESDLPLLSRVARMPIDAALVKGLGNYLCLRRFEELRAGAGAHGDAVRRSLPMLERWARETKSGDVAELDTIAEGDPIWREACSSSDTRIGSACAHHERCFVTKMKQRAEAARLVVVNHHLFFADLALKSASASRGAVVGALPAYDAVIFDEAHQIEDIAAEFFGRSVSRTRVESLVRDAGRALGAPFTSRAAAAGVPVAARPAVAVRSRSRAAVPAAQRSLDASGPAGAARSLLAEVDAASDAFFGEVAQRVLTMPDSSRFGGPAQGPAGGAQAPAAAYDAREARAPLPVDAFAGPLGDVEARLDAALAALASHAKSFGTTEPSRLVVTRAELLRESLEAIASPAKHAVVWAEVQPRNVTLRATPIDVGETLRRDLYERVSSVVMTSATLSIGAASSFAFFRARLGLGARASAPRGPDAGDFESGAGEAPPRDGLDVRELSVPSPFDFASRALLYVPRDLPETTSPTFVREAARRTLELLEITGGGAFVLCTSVKSMRGLAAELARALPRPPLVQGDAPKGALLARFKADGHAVLVATMSFWEGVDVPGEALRLVVIDKIPFAVPTDPVVAARCSALEAEGRGAFMEYSVPQAAITLKQGFGRLLRTRRDRGIVALFDPRLRGKPYGRVLLASMPPARRADDLEQVRAFWSSFDA